MRAGPAVEPQGTREQRWALILLAAGCLPFAVGAAMPISGGDDVVRLAPPCLFRAVTGLPCPLCGATRAVALAAHGDLAFLHYNAVWVVVLAGCALIGGLALAASLLGAEPLQAASRRLRAARRRWPLRCALLLAVLLAVPWSYALVHMDTIVG